MGFKALTVNTPIEQPAHILAEDDAAFYGTVVGGDCVLPVGSQLPATATSSNNVRIGDGMVMVGGHLGRIVKGDYEDMAIANGVSSQNRNDLIVARFLNGGTAGADDFRLVVVQGTPGATAKDPATVQGNLYNGDAQRDYPLWRVRIEGLSIAGVDKMFTVGHMLTDKLDKTGDASNVTNTFTAAAARANITSGEKQSITFGKIMKFFADVISKNIAFMTVVNNGTTTAANTLLDGRMGKTLTDKYNTLNSVSTGNGTASSGVIDTSKETVCRYVKIGHICQVSLVFTPLHTFGAEWDLFTGIPQASGAQDFQYTLYREDYETVHGCLRISGTTIKAWYGNQPKVGEVIRCGFTYVCT